ncbi:MAG: WD40 repeat domain-containing protein [Deltaproteobacteria bacterium]|nr:WD40 repeat domain-containing protein [Deltaproteobacteria bacterium]
MRFGLILILGALATRFACAQPPSEPSTDRWKKVFQTEVQERRRPVYALAFSPDGTLLAGFVSGDPEKDPGGLIQVWDATTGKERPVTAAQRPRSKYSGVQSLIYSPAGNLFATGAEFGNDRPMLFWEVSSGKELPAIKGSYFSIIKVAFSPDSKLIGIYGVRQFADPMECRVRVFEASSKKELFDLPWDRYAVPFVCFLPDSKTLVVPGPKGVLKLLDVSTGKERGQSPAIDGHMFALALKGKAVLAGTGSGTIGLFDLDTGKRRPTFELDSKWRLRALSADGMVLVVVGMERQGREVTLMIKRWNLDAGKAAGLFRTDIDSDLIYSIALSPDGDKLAVGCGEHLSVWVREKAKAE